jgi:hypothetical protein
MENQKKGKNPLVPATKVSAAEMVLREKLADRAKAAWLPRIRCRGGSAPAEEFGRLVFFQGMTPPFFPPQNRGSFPFGITKHYLTHIMGDLPSKRVYQCIFLEPVLCRIQPNGARSEFFRK